MKLKITKSQEKGMLSSNVTFKVKAVVDMTEDERNLIKKYNIINDILLERKKKNIFGELTNDIVKITIFDFMNGQNFSCKNLYEITEFKENLIEAAQKLKQFIEVARTFEGEESIEI